MLRIRCAVYNGTFKEIFADYMAAHTAGDSSTGSSPNDGLQRSLLAAMAQLKPRAVEILILHYEHDYSDADIAKMLGTSRGTIAVASCRTRARLRKLLGRATSGGK